MEYRRWPGTPKGGAGDTAGAGGRATLADRLLDDAVPVQELRAEHVVNVTAAGILPRLLDIEVFPVAEDYALCSKHRNYAQCKEEQNENPRWSRSHLPILPCFGRTSCICKVSTVPSVVADRVGQYNTRQRYSGPRSGWTNVYRSGFASFTGTQMISGWARG